MKKLIVLKQTRFINNNNNILQIVLLVKQKMVQQPKQDQSHLITSYLTLSPERHVDLPFKGQGLVGMIIQKKLDTNTLIIMEAEESYIQKITHDTTKISVRLDNSIEPLFVGKLETSEEFDRLFSFIFTK